MASQPSYNVTFSINHAHLLFAMVTLYSLLKNNSNYYFNVYILHNNCLNNNDVNQAISQYPLNQYKNFKIHLVDVSTVKELQKLKAVKGWTKEIYFKVFLPNLLPNVDKILHLDTDVIIRGNISELLNTNMDGYLFAATYELEIYNDYNVGVMVLNLAKMRQQNTTELLFNVMYNQHINEQDATNLTCKQYIKAISSDYIFVNMRNFNPKFDKNLIIHYTDPKPWRLGRNRHIKDFKARYLNDYYFYYQAFVKPKYKYNFKIYYFLLRHGLTSIYSILIRLSIWCQKHIMKQPKNPPNFVIKKLYKYANIKNSCNKILKLQTK